MVLERSQPAERKLPPCGSLVNRDGACLLVAVRHLGDAVILSSFVRALQSSNPRLAIDILGRPQLIEVVNARCKVRNFIEAEFPAFGHHRRDRATVMSAVKTMGKVRRSRYAFCINLVGDVREGLIGKLSGAAWNIAPIWSSGHPFKKKMTDRGAAWFANCGIAIPETLVSYYDSLSFFANRLGLPDPFARQSTREGPKLAGRKAWVSLHPGASHPSRHWPSSKWKELMERLDQRGFKMQLLGSVNERQSLLDQYSDEIHRFGIHMVTAGVTDLLAALSQSDLLIGMDSFSAHAAFSCSVPAIVLNGSSDQRIMTPPNALPLSAGSLCNKFPCNYSYSCEGSAQEYICCRGIEVSSVMTAVDSIIAGTGE